MLERLRPSEGSKRSRTRKGRGHGSGKGKTAGRGVKGQGTRSNGPNSAGRREGGQMPLQMRLPKRGFHNKWRTECEVVNVADLARFAEGSTVDPTALAAAGLIRGKGAPVKLLGEGEAPKGLTVKIDRISAGARSKIEAAGGSVELVG